MTAALAASLLLAPVAGTAHAGAAAGKVSGSVTIKAGKKNKSDRGNVVVYLENVPGAVKPGKAHTIRQANKLFTPAVSAVTKGTEVHFPNQDKIFHNVFSVSRPARFDLGLYKSGSSKSVTFKRPGVVDIYCNIHPDMIAKVLVLDTGHYATTNRAGKFTIANVPPGTYPVVAWHAHGKEFRGEVTVTSGGTAKLDIELVEKRGKDKHLRKDGTPYGRYK